MRASWPQKELRQVNIYIPAIELLVQCHFHRSNILFFFFLDNLCCAILLWKQIFHCRKCRKTFLQKRKIRITSISFTSRYILGRFFPPDSFIYKIVCEVKLRLLFGNLTFFFFTYQEHFLRDRFSFKF